VNYQAALLSAFYDELEKIAEVPVSTVSGKGGEAPQGVNFRETFHKALNKEKAPGLAVNNPDKGTVDFYGRKDHPGVQKAFSKADKSTQEKAGFGVKLNPTGKSEPLRRVSFSKEDLDKGGKNQGWSREYFAKRGITPKPSNEFVPPRYRLKEKAYSGPVGSGWKPRGSGFGDKKTPAKPTQLRYEGKLPKKAIDQVEGRSPMYQKQFAEAHETQPNWSGKYQYAGNQLRNRFNQTPAGRK